MVFGKEETNSTMVCLSWMQVLLEWQRLACLYLIILVSYVTFHSCVYASFNTIICSPIHWKFCKWKILQIHVLGKPFCYINTRETRCAFAQKHGIFARENNMLSSHVKRLPLLWLHNKLCLSQEKAIKMKWFCISSVFI